MKEIELKKMQEFMNELEKSSTHDVILNIYVKVIL